MNAALTEQERQRNKHKSHFIYPAYRSRNFEAVKPNPLKIKHSFYRDRVLQSRAAMEKLQHDPDRAICPDFPSLHRLPFTAELRRIPVHVSSGKAYSNNLITFSIMMENFVSLCLFFTERFKPVLFQFRFMNSILVLTNDKTNTIWLFFLLMTN